MIFTKKYKEKIAELQAENKSLKATNKLQSAELTITKQVNISLRKSNDDIVKEYTLIIEDKNKEYELVFSKLEKHIEQIEERLVAKDKVIESLKKERAVKLEPIIEDYNASKANSDKVFKERIELFCDSFNITDKEKIKEVEKFFELSRILLPSSSKTKDIHAIYGYFYQLRKVVSDVFYLMQVRDGEYIDEEVVKYGEKLDFALASLTSALSVCKDRKINDQVQQKLKELEHGKIPNNSPENS